MLKKSIIQFLLIICVALSIPNLRAQVLADPLDHSSKGSVTGGRFDPAGGWQAVVWSDLLVYDLGTTLKRGHFQIDVRNLNPQTQNSSPRHHVLSMYTDGTGDHNHDDYNTGRTDRSVWNLHTGTYYSTGLKFLSIAGDKIQTYASDVGFDPNTTHRIEVTWGGGVVELFIDGRLIARNLHEADFSLRHIFIGRDRTHSVDIATGYPGDEYPAMIGPIYSNLAVFADTQVATQPDPGGPETDPGSEPSSTGSGEMSIDINCDDVFDLWVNGSYLGGNGQWDVAQRFTASMRDGENVIAVRGRNTGGATGLVAEVTVGGSVVLSTGTDWRWNSTEQPNWQVAGFNDAGWSAITDLGNYGVSPWGTGISNFPTQSQAHWIWGTGNEVYFRGTFAAAQGTTPSPDPPVHPVDTSPGTGDMEIFVNADDIYDLWVNASLLGHNDQWDVAQRYVAPLASDNLIALKCINAGGLMGAVVEIRIDGVVVFTSDNSWRWDASAASGWSGSGFNDHLWQPVTDLGGYGVSPWGTGISQFPQSSTAHWIWGTGNEVYLRGSFQANATAPPTQPPAPPPPDTLTLANNQTPSPPPADSEGTMEIVINTDDAYSLWVNGAYAGENDQWDQAQRYTVAAVAGENIVAVRGRNRGSGARGLIAQIEIGGVIVLKTGGDWRHSASDIPGWQNPDFNDSGWASASSSGAYGVAPWGLNIAGFPTNSEAQWIWGEGQIEHFRGRFVYNAGVQALKSRSGDEPALASDGFVLKQNYPNPFNPYTVITFDLPQAGSVKLSIYDIRGKEVAVLIDGKRRAGRHTQIWQAVDVKGLPLPSGIYFYRLKLADRERIGKMSLVR